MKRPVKTLELYEFEGCPFCKKVSSGTRTHTGAQQTEWAPPISWVWSARGSYRCDADTLWWSLCNPLSCFPAGPRGHLHPGPGRHGVPLPQGGHHLATQGADPTHPSRPSHSGVEPLSPWIPGSANKTYERALTPTRLFDTQAPSPRCLHAPGISVVPDGASPTAPKLKKRWPPRLGQQLAGLTVS